MEETNIYSNQKLKKNLQRVDVEQNGTHLPNFKKRYDVIPSFGLNNGYQKNALVRNDKIGRLDI